MMNSFFASGKVEVTAENLAAALQQAIEIEIATIPVYLSTYYSINRTPDQGSIKADITERLIKAGIPEDQAAKEALDLSADIMVFCNKAGALIMSVAVEEMLHLALASNVKQALRGKPIMNGRSPATWPARLPGHKPPFDINRASLSLDQLYTFLQIESPKEIPTMNSRSADPIFEYTTIGEFYNMIIAFIKNNELTYHTDRPQLVPGRGYYAQNNINTNYYNKQHQSRFVNAGDSGDLIHVVDRDSALAALDEIVEQGEGNGEGAPLPRNEPEAMANACKHRPDIYDDKDKEEKPHYEKFFDLYCELMRQEAFFKKKLKDDDFDFKQYFVYNTAINPVSTDYPEVIQNLSVLINAVYTYLFIMVEACYEKDENTQFEIFMFGIHKTMLWILSTLCEVIITMKYIGSDGREYNATPTFENYHFSAAASPKAQIIALFNQVGGSVKGIANAGARIHDLPDVSLEAYQQKTGRSLLG